ncbi:MAG: hypothetical protein AB3A66_28710 (plasmid) [Nodularia sp. CChRGM 3473]
MSNLPVFQALLQDNPELFTTEGLSSLLEDCIWLGYPKRRHTFTYPSLLDRSVYLALAELGDGDEDEEIINRIMTDPKGWCFDAPETVQEGAQFYDSMGKMFGTNFGADLFLYHRVRDNIQELQKSLGISGVSQKNISIRDRLFSYPVVEDQLFTLESDRLALQNAVPEIIKYFVSLVQISPAYNLFLVDEDERKISAAVAKVEEATARAVRAEIYTESHDWTQTGANCWQGNHAYKIDPDEIHLCLHLDWEENEFIFFDALHPDPTRWPWAITTDE